MNNSQKYLDQILKADVQLPNLNMSHRNQDIGGFSKFSTHTFSQNQSYNLPAQLTNLQTLQKTDAFFFQPYYNHITNFSYIKKNKKQGLISNPENGIPKYSNTPLTVFKKDKTISEYIDDQKSLSQNSYRQNEIIQILRKGPNLNHNKESRSISPNLNKKEGENSHNNDRNISHEGIKIFEKNLTINLKGSFHNHQPQSSIDLYSSKNTAKQNSNPSTISHYDSNSTNNPNGFFPRVHSNRTYLMQKNLVVKKKKNSTQSKLGIIDDLNTPRGDKLLNSNILLENNRKNLSDMAELFYKNRTQSIQTTNTVKNYLCPYLRRKWKGNTDISRFPHSKIPSNTCLIKTKDYPSFLNQKRANSAWSSNVLNLLKMLSQKQKDEHAKYQAQVQENENKLVPRRKIKLKNKTEGHLKNIAKLSNTMDEQIGTDDDELDDEKVNQDLTTKDNNNTYIYLEKNKQNIVKIFRKNRKPQKKKLISTLKKIPPENVCQGENEKEWEMSPWAIDESSDSHFVCLDTIL